MATNVNFQTATYATTNMLPDANEELTADWARKVMMNTARAAGYWGTVVLDETSVATMGTGFVYFTGFNFMPSMDLWIVAGGTRPTKWNDVYTPPAESGRVLGKRVIYSSAGGTGTIYIEAYPDPGHNQAFGPRDIDFTGSQAQFGTWIYRLRGI